MPLIFGRVLASGLMVPVNVDTDGNIQADILASLPAGDNNIGNVDVVTLPALPAGTNEIGSIQARAYGYIGGAWQKNPLQWGYYGQVLLHYQNLALAAGVNNIDSAAVPANTIWVLTSITTAYVGTIVGVSIFLQIYDGATAYMLYSEAHIVTNEYLDRQGMWVLKAGDIIRYTIAGATLNDDAYLNIAGYAMTLNL